MTNALLRSVLQSSLARSAFRAVNSARAPRDVPWTDQTDAAEELRKRVANGQLSETTARHVDEWIHNGYTIVHQGVNTDDIDAMQGALDGLATAAPLAGLELLSVKPAPEDAPRDIDHGAFLARFEPGERQRILAESNWRVHSFWRLNPAAQRIYQNARLRQIAGSLIGHPVTPRASINFVRGSEQGVHQDMAVFHIWPRNHLVGAWIACEDVTEASGPLLFFPGSHRSSWFQTFDRYPETNLRTCDATTYDAYSKFIAEEAERWPQKLFTAKKGDVLFWHGMLLHGGAPITDPKSTRKSMVIHYMSPGTDRKREIRGPFNW